MSSDVEDEINRLYQLPLNEFTAARNALAKRLGRTAPPIKTLQKPAVPAWAVNQLYWKHRGIYDRLIEAAERLRVAHRKVLAGKSSDLRDTETALRVAVRAAMGKVQTILDESGQPSTPATQRAVSETLEALPSAEPAGRLSRPLKPLGFEALAGVKVRPAFLDTRTGTPAQPAAIDREAAKRAAASERREAEAALRAEAKEKERQRAKLAAERKAQAALERAKKAFEKAEQETERRRDVLQQARDALARVRRLT